MQLTIKLQNFIKNQN